MVNKCQSYVMESHFAEKDQAEAIFFLGKFFDDYAEELENVSGIAFKVRQGIEEIDRFIQLNTSMVCPQCTKVCCINLHAYYDYEDLIYIHALYVKPLLYKDGIPDSEPCQFLCQYGCVRERAVRPFRCNWYFCGTLLVNMENGPAKPYREFINRFHAIIDLRTSMLNEFFRVASDINIKDIELSLLKLKKIC